MKSKDIRSYELSVWNLQDDFIAVIGSSDEKTKGQISEPSFELSTDGTQILKFSIPIKYRHRNKLIDNPCYQNVQNGSIIANLRKVKVIFNKKMPDQKVYELLINNITESHNDNMLSADIECTGLAFEELGHIGHKISLSQELYDQAYEQNSEIKANINFWMDETLKGHTEWSYFIDTDNNEILEDKYIASWQESGGNLIADRIEASKEKERIVSCAQSNIYNITQTIAETFGIFCRYEYEHDENYHIIGRKIIFYKDLLNEDDYFFINYPDVASSITREIDSNDLVTKMYVLPISDDTQLSGEINIAEEEANLSMEDYVLNFNYMRDIGTISDEQYALVAPFETKMGLLNRSLKTAYTNLESIERNIVTAEAEKTIAENSLAAAEEQINETNKLIAALMSSGASMRDENTPAKLIILSGTNSDFILNFSDPYINLNTITYYTVGNDELKLYVGSEEITRDNYTFDDDGIIKSVNFSAAKVNGSTYDLAPGNVIYAHYSYDALKLYNDILETFSSAKIKNEEKRAEYESQLETLNEQKQIEQNNIQNLTASKYEEIARFEKLMGPALREGTWQPDDYTDYGNKESVSFTFASNSSDSIEHFFDDQAWEGEQKGYYTSGIDEQQKQYYILAPKNNWTFTNLDNLTFTYKDENNSDQILRIGSTMDFCLFGNNHLRGLLLIGSGTGITIKNNTDYSLTDGTVTLLKNNLTLYTESIPNIYYPRIKFSSPKIKALSDEINLSAQENIENPSESTILENYKDYNLLFHADESNTDYHYYLNIKLAAFFKYYNYTYTLNYSISNASTSVYLDALRVAEENSYPKVSYELDIENANSLFARNLYDKLGVVVDIIDHDLKLNHVKGYISELRLNLDEPWKDKITIQNYSTKFEDIFQKIVTSSETMKRNEAAFHRASSAVLTTGAISPQFIQNTLNQLELNYSFSNGELTIDENNGIWGTSDTGVVAFRGGGIFTATQKDAFDNWIWNTAITPSGLNASLIRSGQLDTSLIRIFSGDNIAFQMNGDGLYAYKLDANGKPLNNEYVVYNGDGLFLVGEKETEDESVTLIKRVSISWDGLTLRNNSGKRVFYANTDGNLIISGEINADSGKIGGWDIEQHALSSSIKSTTEGSPATIIDSSITFHSDGEGPLGNPSPSESSDLPGTFINVYSEKDDGYFAVDKYGTVHAKNITAEKIIANELVDINNFLLYSLNGYEFSYIDGILSGSDTKRLEGQVEDKTDFSNPKVLTAKPSEEKTGYLIYYKDSGEEEYNVYTSEAESNKITCSVEDVSGNLSIKVGVNAVSNTTEFYVKVDVYKNSIDPTFSMEEPIVIQRIGNFIAKTKDITLYKRSVLQLSREALPQNNSVRYDWENNSIFISGSTGNGWMTALNKYQEGSSSIIDDRPYYLTTASIQYDGGDYTYINQGEWSEPALAGESYFRHAYYSNNINPTDMSQISSNPYDSLGKPYKYIIEIINTQSDFEATSISDFSGYNWIKYVGDAGEAGMDGVNYLIHVSENYIRLNSEGQIRNTSLIVQGMKQESTSVTASLMTNVQYCIYMDNGIQVDIKGAPSENFIVSDALTIDFSGAAGVNFRWHSYITVNMYNRNTPAALLTSIQIPYIVDSSEVIAFTNDVNNIKSELRIGDGGINAIVQEHVDDLKIGARNYLLDSKSFLKRTSTAIITNTYPVVDIGTVGYAKIMS